MINLCKERINTTLNSLSAFVGSTKRNLEEKHNRKVDESGVTLAEVIIVIIILGVMVSLAISVGMPAFKKAKSGTLSSEYEVVLSTVASLSETTKSIVPTFTVDIPTKNISKLKITIPASLAFNTVASDEAIRPSGNQSIKSTIGINTFGITLGSGLADTNAKLNYCNLEGISDTVGTPLNIPDLSARGASGLSPIFLTNDESLLRDFVRSPNGLDLLDFENVLVKAGGTDIPDYAKIISLLLGGTTDPATIVDNNDYDVASPNKRCISLTKADINLLKDAESTQKLKYVSNTNDGQLFITTNRISRTDFIDLFCNSSSNATFKNALVPIGGEVADETAQIKVLNQIYDRLSLGFGEHTPVLIPYKYGSLIKTQTSDLKYGFYRP